MRLSVVIAAYDERENIEELTRRLDQVLSALPEADYEMVFVVEGDDGTREVLEALSAELGHIRILYAARPAGLGNAFRRGFAAVSPNTDFVITMDADFNHDPAEIPPLLDELRQRRLDVLVGSRFVRGSCTVGIPLWKRALSVIMNRFIATLFDVETLDKTSGFRIYRAGVLPQLVGFRNDDFAFLPEVLIRATERGLRIGEAPIHFTFRTRGQSKMSIAKTCRSYLSLLGSRFDRLTVAALALMGIGAVLRVLCAFPTHKFPPDADALLTGLRALDILSGKLRVFYSGTRIGALESYLHVPALLLMGITRAAVSIAPLLSGVAILVFFFFLVRELAGRSAAVFGLLFLALPSPSWTWLYIPNGYAETLLICIATLYLAARLARTGHRDGWTFLLGLAVGAGIWQSVETLTCTGPAVVWLAAQRRADLKRSRPWLIGMFGCVAGAIPWILYNVVHPFGVFRNNFAVRPARGWRDVVSNLSYFFRDEIPALLGGTDPFHVPRVFVKAEAAERILRFPVAAAYTLAFGFLLLKLRPGGEPDPPRGRHSSRSAALLFLLVVVAVAAAVAFSEAGQTRGYTVRYVMPVYYTAAAALGIASSAAWKRHRVSVLAVCGVVVLFNALAYALPWDPYREFLRDLDLRDRALVSYLKQKRISWICGNYWVVYPFNYLSKRQITGIPFQSNLDFYSYATRFTGAGDRWALVTLEPSAMKAWLHNCHLEGHVEKFADRFYVFLPADDERGRRSMAQLLLILQQARPPGQ